MSDTSKKWQEVLDALVSGHPIDWDGVDPAGKDLAPLRQLQHIQLAMKEQLHTHIEDVPDQYAFQWGHLYAIRSIGSGGFGEVYLCHDAALCRPVALKLLNEERIRSWQKNQFIEEARNMARVRSPHVLTIHGAAMHQGQVGFWCDFIKGQALDQVDVSGDWQQAVSMMQSLALALQSVHDSDLVHGDIKPANVMLSDNGRYVLMDFGGSLLGDEADRAAANWVGSPQYMAPELFGEHHKTPATDVYALGLLFIQQLTGQSIFQAENWIQLNQQKQQAMRWPEGGNQVPKFWRELLLNMCDLDPARRPDANTVVRTIADLKTRPERLRKRNLRWAVMGLLLSGLLLSWWAIWQVQNTKTQLETEKGITEQVNQFLSELLDAGSSMGQGREVRMVDVIDASAEKIDVTLADSPSSRAQLHQAVGNSYNSLRLPEKAFPHLQQSLALFQQTEGPHAVNAIKAQLELSFTQLLLGQLDESEALIDQAVEWSVSGPESLHVLALIRLARVKLRKDDNQAVIDLLQPWLHLTEPPINTVNNLPTMLLTNLSDAHYNLGQFDQALALAQKAKDILPMWPKVVPTNAMSIHTMIAKSAARAGDIDLALRNFSELVDQSVLYYGEGNSEHISSLINYGAILNQHDRYQESIVVLKQAFELAEQKFGMQHRTTIQAGGSYANAMTKNNMLDQSQALMESLLPHSAETFGETHQIHLMITYNLVELLNQRQNYEQAWPLTAQNSDVAEQNLGPNHPMTLYIMTNKATTHAGLGQFDPAWALFAEVDQRNGTENPKVQDLYEVSQRLQQQVRQWQAETGK